MSNRDHGRMLLHLAHEDLGVLRGMTDANIFPTRVFGFHAQQAVEKGINLDRSAVIQQVTKFLKYVEGMAN